MEKPTGWIACTIKPQQPTASKQTFIDARLISIILPPLTGTGSLLYGDFSMALDYLEVQETPEKVADLVAAAYYEIRAEYHADTEPDPDVEYDIDDEDDAEYDIDEEEILEQNVTPIKGE